MSSLSAQDHETDEVNTAAICCRAARMLCCPEPCLRTFYIMHIELFVIENNKLALWRLSPDKLAEDN